MWPIKEKENRTAAHNVAKSYPLQLSARMRRYSSLLTSTSLTKRNWLEWRLSARGKKWVGDFTAPKKSEAKRDLAEISTGCVIRYESFCLLCPNYTMSLTSNNLYIFKNYLFVLTMSIFRSYTLMMLGSTRILQKWKFPGHITSFYIMVISIR